MEYHVTSPATLDTATMSWSCSHIANRDSLQSHFPMCKIVENKNMHVYIYNNNNNNNNNDNNNNMKPPIL